MQIDLDSLVKQIEDIVKYSKYRDHTITPDVNITTVFSNINTNIRIIIKANSDNECSFTLIVSITTRYKSDDNYNAICIKYKFMGKYDVNVKSLYVYNDILDETLTVARYILMIIMDNNNEYKSFIKRHGIPEESKSDKVSVIESVRYDGTLYIQEFNLRLC